MEKLSIAIPTYNRASLLKRCINSFIDDAVGFGVHVYISDNCSTDNTYDIIEEFQSKYPNSISYFCQSENLGIDRNMLTAIQLAGMGGVCVLAW